MPETKFMSIVIPNRNSPVHYLENSLESVARQSVGANALEVIVVDDYSTPYGRKQLRRAVDTARRQFPELSVSVCANIFPQGLGSARNTGVIKAATDFIGCLDTDDALRKDAVAQSAEKHQQGSYDLVFSDYERRDECLRELTCTVFRSEIFRAHQQYKGTLLDPLIHGSFTEHFTVLRRSSVLRIGYRNIACPDYDLPIRLSTLSKEANFGHTQEALYIYRRNPQSLSNRLPQLAAANRTVEQYILEFLRENGFAETESVRLLHEAPNSPSFFDVIVGNRPVEVPWFNRQSRQYRFARYFVH